MDPTTQLQFTTSEIGTVRDENHPEQEINVEAKTSRENELQMTNQEDEVSESVPAKETGSGQASDVRGVENDNKEDETKGEDADDEQKEVERPLIEDKEMVAIDLGLDENYVQGNDTPTLPLPEKKPLPDVDMTIIEDSKDSPPPIFQFPLGRIRYEWKNTSSWPEFFGRTICIIFATLGWAFFVGGVPLISVVMLIMGSIYKDDCPYEPRIPTYLIVSGFFGTLQLICRIIKKVAPERFLSFIKDKKIHLLEGLLQIFLFIWFILGCVWVYSAFEPEYENQEFVEYCNKSVYLFAYWILNLTFIILCCLMIFSFCIILIVASSVNNTL